MKAMETPQKSAQQTSPVATAESDRHAIMHCAANTLQAFAPLDHIHTFQARFPAEMELLRLAGLHPLHRTHPINPYTLQPSNDSFSNIGEHCIAVAYCAATIASALVQREVLSEQDAHWITAAALLHDANKSFEIMRRDAQRAGLIDDAYSVAAYDELGALLQAVGFAQDPAERLSKAGSEAGHNSLRLFIKAEPDGSWGLTPGLIREKVVHLADDMTFSSNPPYPHERFTAFMPCDERMRAAKCDEKYPFLWTEGLVRQRSGEIAAVKNINAISADETLLGSYAELQVQVSRLISRELQHLITPASDAAPEAFMCQLMNSSSSRRASVIESAMGRAA